MKISNKTNSIRIMAILAITTFFTFACSNNEKNTNANTSETKVSEPTSTEPASTSVEIPADINDLLSKNTCLSCHDVNDKVVGPAYKEVAKRNYTNEQIVELIYKPKPSNWPDYSTPMVGLPNVPKDEALKIAAWINSLK